MRPFQRPVPPQEPTAERTPPPGNLPAALSRFVGREQEVAALAERLESHRLTTVTGVGGVGKTRLALRTAASARRLFADGVWHVELSTLRDGELLAHTVAEALVPTECTGSLPASPRPDTSEDFDGIGRFKVLGAVAGSPRAALLRHFRDRETLLVLDGCEHLVAECAELAGALLRHAPGLRVLVTSRRPLEIAGEQVFPLAPMEEREAVALFSDRASAVLPGFDVSGDNESAVSQLCRHLDGIPLALELAAGQLRALSVEQIAHRLHDRFRLLTNNDRSALPRHRTLSTAIGWSHELCTAQERLLWARLSVFAGDFDLEAVEYLCADGELPVDAVLTVLSGLVAQSVVLRDERDGAAGQARYRLLDTVREYGARWLEELDESEGLRRRHRDWYLGLATWCELDWFSGRQTEIAAQLDRELPNLRLALEYCLESPQEAHTGQYLAATLWFYWLGCGRPAEGQLWLDRALVWAGEQPEARAKALWVAGLTSLVRGDDTGALAMLCECLELAEVHDDRSAGVHGTQMMGCLALVRDDLEQAKSLLGEVLRRLRKYGELNTLTVLALVQLAMAHAFDGELDEAVALGEEARALSSDSDERWALSYALYALAYAHMQRGDTERARALSLQCLTIKREFQDVLGMTLALQHLAPLTAEAEPERAAEMLGAASAGWRMIGTDESGPQTRSRPFESPSEDCRDHVLAALGEEEYTRARQRGRDLGLTALVTREVIRHPGTAAQPDPPGVGCPAGGHRRTGTRRPAVPPPPA